MNLMAEPVAIVLYLILMVNCVMSRVSCSRHSTQQLVKSPWLPRQRVSRNLLLSKIIITDRFMRKTCFELGRT